MRAAPDLVHTTTSEILEHNMPFVLPSQLLINALRENDLIPSVVPENFAPSVELSVEFSGKRFTPGEKLTKEETSEEPKISFIDTDDIGPNGPSSYTLVLVDPDAPSRAEPIYGQWRHWVQSGLIPVSIQALATIQSGQEDKNIAISEASAIPIVEKSKIEAATPYLGPGPRPNSGTHRYTFLLYREPRDGFSLTAADMGSNEFTQRRSWNATEFAVKNGLTLVGATFFLVDS